MSTDRPRVVVTRARDAATALAGRLEAAGFAATVVPLIETEPLVSPADVAAALGATAGGWVVLTSAVAARLVVAAPGQLPPLSFAAVGGATAAVLRSGLPGTEVVVSDGPADAAGLARTIAGRVADRPVLVLAAEEGRRILAPALRAAGGDVTELVAYRTVLPSGAPAAFRAALTPLPDVLLLASGSAARHAARIVAPAEVPVPLVLCIGPQTAAAAREAGWANVEVSAEATDDGVIAALRSRCLGE